MNNIFLDDLQSRGLIFQQTADLKMEEKSTLYCGFDPSADSLHIGSLVPLVTLTRAQRFGYTPIALLGGATGMIGDPSFKSKERVLLDVDMIADSVGRIKTQIEHFIDLDQGAIVANNIDWTRNLDTISFLRDVGKHFSVNTMIKRDSVSTRLEREGEGISFTEFAYMLLQSMDYVELYRRFNCTLQIGGSDQWGNIISGVDLVRRQMSTSVHGLTLPLITKSDGEKFGKTESGTIWLDENKTSAYAFYQFWLNTADSDVYRFLNYFTFLAPQEIAEIEQADSQIQGRKQAQTILAKEVTEFIHGTRGVKSAKRISKLLFSGGVAALTVEDWQAIERGGLPVAQVSDGTELTQALVDSGIAKNNRGEASRAQARKLLEQEAIKMNGELVRQDQQLSCKEALAGKYILLQRGKKTYSLLRITKN